jgi:hypothetical protein
MRSSVSMAELIRRAVDATYRPRLRPVVRGYHLNVGLFQDPDAALVGRMLSVPRRIVD